MIAPRLSTDRLTLRPFAAEDFPAYRAYRASPRSTMGTRPMGEAEAFETFAAMLGHWQLRGFGRYAIERDGAAIGHVGPFQNIAARPPEMTWTLWDSAAEGRGYATEAAARIVDHLLGENGWERLVAFVHKDNAASHAVARRLGAEPAASPAPAAFPGAVTYRFSARKAAR